MEIVPTLGHSRVLWKSENWRMSFLSNEDYIWRRLLNAVSDNSWRWGVNTAKARHVPRTWRIGAKRALLIRSWINAPRAQRLFIRPFIAIPVAWRTSKTVTSSCFRLTRVIAWKPHNLKKTNPYCSGATSGSSWKLFVAKWFQVEF